MPEDRLPKVLIIGLDAAEPRLLEQWIADGTLPALRGLMNDALWGAVENPTGFDAGAAWPSFATGLTPGRHGQFDGTKRLDPETYATRQLRRDELRDPFWKTLSDAGKSVAVVDVPYALLEPTLNGIQLVDWLSHSRAGPGHIQSTPADLAETIIADFGDDPFGRTRLLPNLATILLAEPGLARPMPPFWSPKQRYKSFARSSRNGSMPRPNFRLSSCARATATCCSRSFTRRMTSDTCAGICTTERIRVTMPRSRPRWAIRLNVSILSLTVR